MDDALRLAPFLPDFELFPDLAIAPFDEIEAIGVGMNCQLDGEVTQDAVTVSGNEATQRRLDLEKPCPRAISNG